MPGFYFDISVDWGRFVLHDGTMDIVQELLREHAPAWSSGLHVLYPPRPRTPVEVTVPGALERVIESNISTHGPTYYKRIEEQGFTPPYPVGGSSDLRGANGQIVVVTSVDDRPFRRSHESGQTTIRYNYLTVQIFRKRVEGVRVARWAERFLEALCERTGPCYGFGGVREQYYAKNMVTEGGTYAMGRDFSRYLPGLYWLNFFGPPYTDLIGLERLLSAPAYAARPVGSGVLVEVDADPQCWDTPEYMAAERRVLQHIGPHYFFDRRDPEQPTVAPDWAKYARSEPGSGKD